MTKSAYILHHFITLVWFIWNIEMAHYTMETWLSCGLWNQNNEPKDTKRGTAESCHNSLVVHHYQRFTLYLVVAKIKAVRLCLVFSAIIKTHTCKTDVLSKTKRGETQVKWQTARTKTGKSMKHVSPCSGGSDCWKQEGSNPHYLCSCVGWVIPSVLH